MKEHNEERNCTFRPKIKVRSPSVRPSGKVEDRLIHWNNKVNEKKKTFIKKREVEASKNLTFKP